MIEPDNSNEKERRSVPQDRELVFRKYFFHIKSWKLMELIQRVSALETVRT